jgi:hypothetical protein
MLYPSPDDWVDWGITDKCHQFFCLHWAELFDPETPDTWQVRACNVKTILRELIEASRMAGGFDAYRGVMRSILDEAFAIVKHDVILENRYPFVSAYLAPWAKGEIGKEAVSEIERLAIVLLGNLDGYWDDGVQLLKDMLRQADKGKKKELYALTMNVAVETVARGRSPNHIRQTFLATVLARSTTPFLERIANVFARYATQGTKYKCVFLTRGVKKKDAEGLPSDIKLGFGKPAEPADPTDSFFKGGPSVWLSVDVEADDPEEAKSKADKRLGELYASLNLFSIDDRFGLKVPDALVVDEAGGKTVVGRRRLGSQYLGSYDSRMLKADLFFRVQERLRRTSPSDASQLAAAIEYHRLALLATSDEARLVNLWIALEALCQGGEGSIIERVWSLIKAIHTVLIDLDRQPRWTIKDSLEHRLKLFEYAVEFFRKKPDHEIGAATITDPETCLRPQTAPFAWPPPPVVVAAPAGPV